MTPQHSLTPQPPHQRPVPGKENEVGLFAPYPKVAWPSTWPSVPAKPQHENKQTDGLSSCFYRERGFQTSVLLYWQRRQTCFAERKIKQEPTKV